MTPPNARVVRLTNVPYDVVEEDIRQLFGSCVVVDQIRTIDPQVGTSSNVYVLFSTVQDSNAVVERYGDLYVDDHRVTTMLAPTGNYSFNASQDSFARPRDTDTASAAAESLSTALNRTISNILALGITREKGARLQQEQQESIREERSRADYINEQVIRLVLMKRMMASLPRYKDQDRRKQPPGRASIKHLVPAPDLRNRQDPRSRVLLITDLPTEADNDAVMTFLQEYRPESIDRTQIGGNWMVSALVLMQTTKGRDWAVKNLNGEMIQGQRVTVQTFSNLTQDVLDRIMNPEASVPDANANSPRRSRIARSTVPPAAKAPYVPFGTPPAQVPVGSAPSTSYLPFGSSNPLPAASAAPKPSAIASILGDKTLNQESPQAPSDRTHEDIRGRRNQIAAGD
ncbi:hypothetical protein J4E82_004944 [Alternaria postmessia]|uniref:uncharacterized protein n=1 Tax=Alternaria postmessia TaxID=1187938 RepID=UPI002224C0F6|nr:uncharacterized protein J4E82_004944 [Alternaria postmessia]KAI5376448.1 hypothetical protein J4E82_004944 [Alternaria postmessia]